MKVCDKCRKTIEKGNVISLKNKKAEICDDCATKIVNWLDKEDSNIFNVIMGGRR